MMSREIAIVAITLFGRSLSDQEVGVGVVAAVVVVALLIWLWQRSH